MQEDFRQSMFLCPIDLKKLLVLFDFEPVDRYIKLRDYFAKNKSTSEIEWLDKAIATLSLVKN